MVEPIVEPTDLLSCEEIRSLSPQEKGGFIESSILSLININGNRGLTLSEIENTTKYPKNSLIKHVELLRCKRKIHKISRGRFGIYYPNIDTHNEVRFRDIMYGVGDSHRYGVRIINNINGKHLLIQEREIDGNGFVEDIGGVLIPMSKISELTNMLLQITNNSEIMPRSK